MSDESAVVGIIALLILAVAGLGFAAGVRTGIEVSHHYAVEAGAGYWTVNSEGKSEFHYGKQP